MYRRFIYCLAAVLTVFSASQCAKEASRSNDDVQKKILDAYIEVYCPGAEVTSSGLVILSEEPGTGAQMEWEKAAYTITNVWDLNNSCLESQDKELAKELGMYESKNYYGPRFHTAGYGSEQLGFSEALCRMREGGRIKVILPPWLSYFDYYANGQNKSENSGVNLMYDIKMLTVITDLTEYQNDSLRSYARRFDIKDPEVEAFYFKKVSGTQEDTIKQGKTAKIRYVGKLLDGYVFDTNIADTARKYDIYDASNSYEALSVTYEATYQEMSTYTYASGQAAYESSSLSSGGGDSDKLIPGFAKALKHLTYGDHGITFFGSQWGYGSKGTMSGSSGVPTYSMLFFDIYIEEKDD